MFDQRKKFRSITKCDGIITKLGQLSLLQNIMDSYQKLGQLFLLQSATWFITNCNRHYKVRWIYYKLLRV